MIKDQALKYFMQKKIARDGLFNLQLVLYLLKNFWKH